MPISSLACTDRWGLPYQNSELLQEVGGVAIAPTTILKPSVFVQYIDHIYCHPMLFLQKLQVGYLIASKASDNTVVRQELHNLPAFLHIEL